MTDISDIVPQHKPGMDALASLGKGALSAVPIAGPILAESLAYLLDAKQAQRKHAFDTAVAGEVAALWNRLEDAPMVEDVFGSDEFIAAVTRAQRAASETASESKRRRLAVAVAHGGSWAPFTATERERFTRLVDEFSDLHVFLLHYFTDPKAWLVTHDLYAQHANTIAGSISGPLESAFGDGRGDWSAPTSQALGDLDRAGLASVPLNTTMTAQGIFAPRTSEKGRRFLEFIAETASSDATPPATI